MRTIILLTILTLGCWGYPLSINATGLTEHKTELPFRPVSNQGGTTHRPQKPAFCPIYGELNGSTLTIHSKIAGDASIEVSYMNGCTINENVAELLDGYELILPYEPQGATVQVTLNGITYSAQL